MFKMIENEEKMIQGHNVAETKIKRISFPAIVLDASCMSENDLSCAVMRKINDINALSNLYAILSNEGFDNVKLSYLGGFWVLIDAGTILAKGKLINHVGVSTWFTELREANNSFVSEVRLVWISVEGLPLCKWNKNALSKIVSPWGTMFDVDTVIDASFPYKNLCVVAKLHNELVDGEKKDTFQDQDMEHVLESSCMKEKNDFKIHDSGSSQGAHSIDPFGIYNLLNKKEDKAATKGDEPTYPPGFTPKDVNDKVGEDMANSVNQPDTNFYSLKEGVSSVKSVINRSLNLKSGGSILDVIENLVEDGQTMRYNMEGCMKNIDAIPLFGFSGGILCVWDPNVFSKDNVTISDSFMVIRGTWTPTSTKLMIVFVYAPQDLSEKKALWDYISHVIVSWDGECVILGDFNEVRPKQERFGSIFNEAGAKAFNHLISMAGLIDLPLEDTCQIIDLLLCGRLLFDSWKNLNLDEPNKITLLRKKFQALKALIKTWCKEDKHCSNASRCSIQSWLSDIDKLFDKGKSSDDLVSERTSLLKDLHNLDARLSLDMAQKAKICEWIDEPSKVKNEFLNHYSNRFSVPSGPNIVLDSHKFNQKQITSDQNANLECDVTSEEIKRAVWDCGTNKSPGPDGFTFEFIRRYWKIISPDVVNAIREFFGSSKFPPGRLFKGIHVDDSLTLSYLFYAGDVVFIVTAAANIIRCSTFSIPFNYLGVKVEMSSSRSNYWDDVLAKISSCLSNWKVKTLSIDLYGDRVSIDGTEKVGNGAHTLFWEDSWITDSPLRQTYPQLYALESVKHVSIANKLNDVSLTDSVRRGPRGGLEEEQYLSLIDIVAFVVLFKSNDRWVWSLESADKLPMRLNLSLRGIDIPSIICPICNAAGESCSHILFSCNMARLFSRRVARWWELNTPDFISYEDCSRGLYLFSYLKGLRKSWKVSFMLRGG
nr:RNA-directed DNA polymerase, eukaryota [Tanacetum cinerariifolium]